MATNEAKVEFLKTRPEHKVQVGGATYVCRTGFKTPLGPFRINKLDRPEGGFEIGCKHLAEKLNNGEPVVESEIMDSGSPGEFAARCIPCAEYIWVNLHKH